MSYRPPMGKRSQRAPNPLGGADRHGSGFVAVMLLLGWLTQVVACGGEVQSPPGSGSGPGPESELNPEPEPELELVEFELGGERVCTDLAWDGAHVEADVVVLLFDTVRRDRMEFYGGEASTPAFDAFADANLRFDRAFTQAPWTKPAVASLFTSLYPSQHGLLTGPEERAKRRQDHEEAGSLLVSDRLSGDFETLAEVMRTGGYRTAAFVTNPWVDARFGFDQGFDVFDDDSARWSTADQNVTKRGLAWLESQSSDSKVFAYLHLLGAHQPYPALTQEDLDAHETALREDRRPLNWRAQRMIPVLVRLADGRSLEEAGIEPSQTLLRIAYDKGVEASDRALGAILARLETLNRPRPLAVIVTSDHGEALFERGYGNHGFGLFDDELAIPLAMRLPGVQTPDGPASCGVGLIDLLPTLCEYLDIDCPKRIAGRSLLAEAPDRPRFLASEGVGQRPRNRAIRNARFKLSYEPAPGLHPPTGHLPYALYDLTKDPQELVDLLGPDVTSASSEHVADVLLEAMHAEVAKHEPVQAEVVPVDADLREELEALGYLDAESGNAQSSSTSEPDQTL